MALLVSACGFNEQRKFTIINENSDTDGTFLISSLIGQRLKQQGSVVLLLCFHQSYKYYEACGKKLGYNLSMSVMKKSLILIESLRDLTTNTKLSDHTLDILYENIMKKLNDIKENGAKNITLIFDDFMFLTNLGSSESDILKMIMRLYEYKQNNELSIIFKFGLADLHKRLTNILDELADVSISVEKLSSGNFWDVDGRLSIKKTKCENGFYSIESEKTFLYHIGDHNIKLLAPGEFGLKF